MRRRDFLKATAGTIAMGTAPLIRVRTRKTQTYRTALVGTGWWGMNILHTALESGTIQVTGVCDVDESQLARAANEVSSLTGTAPNRYTDYGDLLRNENLDIVIVATPDHWHALPAIAAMQAGAHVYLEKPICHTIDEGKAILSTARTANRKVQIGTHRRVSPHNMSAMEFLRAGGAGSVGMVRAFVHYGGGPGEPIPDEDPPLGLDWNAWCGPAPLRPFNPRIHPRGFRQYLDFANGQLGDWGIHWLDQILWWTDETFPHTVHSAGGRHIKQDGTDAPDTQVATFAFENFTATWEHRQYAANNAETTNIGCYFYGTKGTLHLGWQDGWSFYSSSSREPVLHEDPQLNEPDGQNISGLWDDLISSIEQDRLPVCDVEHGYRATNMCLLGMMSMKLGRSVRWDLGTESVLDDPEANALMHRQYRAPWTYPEH